MELSLVILALNEADNLSALLPKLNATAAALVPSFELIVVDGRSRDNTVEVARANGARVIEQQERGYGAALREGFAAAHGRFVATVDADLSHDPEFLRPLWQARNDAEIIVASRYVPGGAAEMPLDRKVLSRALNLFFRSGLHIPVRDLSSGYRLYHASCLRQLDLQSNDFDILLDILIQCYARGWQVREIPFRYLPRVKGRSHAQLLRFGISYLRTFRRLWSLRNSIESADYDERAHDSWIPLQRYWQRRRYRVVTNLTPNTGLTLDIGCGSSRILSAFSRIVGADIQVHKLRYARKFGKPVAAAAIQSLPFRDGTFDSVICSEVIEHIPAGDEAFCEMRRVLKDGGLLVLGTPDYGRWTWRALERMYKLMSPGGYADEHITQYTFASLLDTVGRHGFHLEDSDYVGTGEMILRLRKNSANGVTESDR